MKRFMVDIIVIQEVKKLLKRDLNVYTCIFYLTVEIVIRRAEFATHLIYVRKGLSKLC